MSRKAEMRQAGAHYQFRYTPDYWVIIEPRTGDRWRTTICDTAQLGEDLVHVADIHADTTHPLELLRLALNDYRDHRGPVPA